MIVDLGVVDDPPAGFRRLRTQLAGERCVLAGVERRKQSRQLGHDVGREVARIGARVGEQLVTLVERLGELEGALRAQPEPTVRSALERGEIEEQRRWLAHRACADALDHGGLRPIAGDDRVGHRGGREPRQLAVAPDRRERLAGTRPHLRPDLPVVARHERKDLPLALDDHREGRGLDATDRVERGVADLTPTSGDRAGRVHANEPVRLGARTRSVAERIELGARAQRREAASDRLVGQRRDPQALHRCAGAGELVDIAEDQLAFATGITRVDDRGDGTIAEELRDRAQLR